MVKIGKYDYKKSTNPKKKLMVVVNNKTIHFGSRDMEHFKDKTGIWKSKNYKNQTGEGCAKWLMQFCINNKKQLPEIFIHSANPVGEDKIKDVFFDMV